MGITAAIWLSLIVGSASCDAALHKPKYLPDPELDAHHVALMEQYPARTRQPEAVRRAIRKHVLIDGMTYGEAVAAIGRKPECLIVAPEVTVAWQRTLDPDYWHTNIVNGMTAGTFHLTTEETIP